MFKNFTSALFKEDKGFTLIELMVVMTIVSIMTAVVLANYRAGGRQLALDRSANRLAQDIRRAQEMAMSASEVNGSVPHGFGIIIVIEDAAPLPPLPFSISTTTYRIYADMDGDREFSSSPPDEIISEIDLEKGVFIVSIEVEDPPANPHRVFLTFSPPDPEVHMLEITGAAPPHFGTKLEITLALEADLNKKKVIKVNQAGLIYVE